MFNSIRVDSSLWSFRLALRTILPNRSCRGRCWLVLDMVVLLASKTWLLWFALLRADDYFDSRLGRSCLADFVVDNSDNFQIGLTFLASRLCFVRSHYFELMDISLGRYCRKMLSWEMPAVVRQGGDYLASNSFLLRFALIRTYYYFDSRWGRSCPADSVVGDAGSVPTRWTLFLFDYV